MFYLRMVIFMSIILFVFFGLHALIYTTIWRFLPGIRPSILTGIKWAFLCFPILFVCTSLIASRYNNILIRTLYTTSAVWIGYMYFLLAASLLIWMLSIATRIVPFPINMQWMAGILFIAAICVGIYGIINANDTRVTSLSITIPDLPSQWKGRTIAWISDVHLGQVHGEEFAEKLVSMIQQQHPDIIIIGGDLFDGVSIGVDAAMQPFAQLTAPQGVYFITGNHEEFTEDTKFTDAVRRAGIHILNNESVVKDGLRFLGVDFNDSEDKDFYVQTLAGLDRAYPTILFKHAPNNVETTKQYPIALQLSGHTHHGQVWPLGYISSRVFHGFDQGYKQIDNLQTYTSMGAGTWGPPFRVGTTPEIVVITLQ